jgi:hypothetical protein
MFINAKCKKCGESGVIDIGDHNQKEVEQFLSKAEFGECQFGGWHVEIGKMINYLEVDWSRITETREELKGEI